MPIIQHLFSARDIEVNGEQKRLWHKVGAIKETKNGGKFAQLFWLDKDLYVFDAENEKPLPTID